MLVHNPQKKQRVCFLLVAFGKKWARRKSSKLWFMLEEVAVRNKAVLRKRAVLNPSLNPLFFFSMEYPSRRGGFGKGEPL